MLKDFKIYIEGPVGDETEAHIVVWNSDHNDPIIDAPAAEVEVFALSLISTVARAKRKRHPGVQRGG